VRSLLLATAAVGALFASDARAGELAVSTSTFQANTGEAANLTSGSPIFVDGTNTGTTANANDAGLGVFANHVPDGNFGITSPLAISLINPLGSVSAASVYNGGTVLPTSQFVTSFSSKSEGSLYLTPDGGSVTVVGYHVTTDAFTPGPVGALDVSNSSTSANTIAAGVAAGNSPRIDNRTVAQFNLSTLTTQTTDVNAYSGNNGRSGMLINGQYYLAGNGNLGNTGVELATPGVQAGAAAGSPANTQQIGQFAISQAGYPQGTDKILKDNNFRGMTEFNNTLYVTKGSGGNGIDTVYQVGDTGALANGQNLAPGPGTPIKILPGFPKDLAKTGPNFTPFGLFFANATTLYVGDEGTGDSNDVGPGSHAGLEKWSLVGGTWTLDYTLQAGLIGHTDSYAAPGFTGTVTTEGLRDITGMVNADGTVTLYGVSSTTDNVPNMDNGADPNALWTITDNLADTTLPLNESFSEVITPSLGTIVRGVVLVPEPAALSVWGVGLAGLILRRRRRAA
jgi:hypothetical protein